MPPTTRTLGPLHFEDLEPHRFEDLVRHLIYDFKPWRQLEATGRAGSDESYDVRGWEVVSNETELEPLERDDDDGELIPPDMESDRVWLIQGKREWSIGPTKLIKYLDASPEAERPQLYGLIDDDGERWDYAECMNDARPKPYDDLNRSGFAGGSNS